MTIKKKKKKKRDIDIQEIYDYQIDPKNVQDKLTELEDRFRRNNARIDEIKEVMGETRNGFKEKVQDKCAQKLGLESIEIERAH